MTTASNTVEAIAQELGEQNFDARRQLSLIVEALGDEASLALVEKAMEIDDDGGERVLDGSRRRTPSGIFFRLARERLPHEAIEHIFPGRGGRSSPPELEVPSAPRAQAKPPARRRVIDVRTEMRETIRPPAAAPSAVEVARGRIAAALAPLDTEVRRSLLEALVSSLTPQRRRRSQASGERSKRATPSAPSLASSFVVSMPMDLPTSVVLERAKEVGIALSASEVDDIRAALRRKDPDAP